ncbi:MAG TPA: pilus assembly protein PilM [Vicinamibacterales bacterium]|nr:pilus assembly protein PilM [Vicinamibacterales bacterium]
MSTGSGRLPAFLVTAPPAVALEIASDRVTAAAVSGTGAGLTLAAHAIEPLPAGAVVPALNATNIHDAASVTAAVRSVLARLGVRARRVALVVPDMAAKVSLLRFEKIPPRAQDLEQLIKWQVRKAAPFKPEESQMCWLDGATLEGGAREFIVLLARADVIRSYEAAVEAAGVQPGIVDLASFDLINAALATGAPAGDWLLVHVAAEYATLTIVRGRDVIFFRTRPREADGDLAELVHQTAMYYEDRLGGAGFGRVVLAGAAGHGSDGGERARRNLEERLGTRVESLDFRQAAGLRDRIAAGPDLLDALAPAVGVLLRDRAAERVA